MGASNFSNRATARTAAEAYQALVNEARHEYGHRGYTGTIAESHGFSMVRLRPGESIEECEERVIEADGDGSSGAGSKWGPAACVDLGPDPAAPGCRRYAFFGWAAT